MTREPPRRSPARRSVLLYQWDVTGQPLASLYQGEIDRFAAELAEAVAARARRARRADHGGGRGLDGRPARRGRAERAADRACTSSRRGTVPREVAIDEAVRLAKRYATDDAAQARQRHPRADRERGVRHRDELRGPPAACRAAARAARELRGRARAPCGSGRRRPGDRRARASSPSSPRRSSTELPRARSARPMRTPDELRALVEADLGRPRADAGAERSRGERCATRSTAAGSGSGRCCAWRPRRPRAASRAGASGSGRGRARAHVLARPRRPAGARRRRRAARAGEPSTSSSATGSRCSPATRCSPRPSGSRSRTERQRWRGSSPSATLGMIGGQYLDVFSPGADPLAVTRLKTGRLFDAAVACGLWAADVPEGAQGPWRAFAAELGADQHRDQAAAEEEEEGGDDVLDPDHLVIGVEAEVVLPRGRPVLGVLLGNGRLARCPAEPVVEAAQSDQEAERSGDRGDDQVRVARLLGLEDLQPGDRAQGDDEAEAEAEAEREAQPGARHSRSLQCRHQVLVTS